ncbi:MAG: hypothetical protein KDD04_03985, partial [Sinomicrobium sp.]|nr:hypothetical protein [Sinomicrobium sp.]
MRKLATCIVLLFAAVNTIFSQELPEIIPHNPEVSALGKYGDIPIGYFTGVPNISIPLVTLQGQNMNIPVSISYHASGIRVSEIASRVGLGWSLSAGGAVTRSMRGIPDDTPGAGYLYTNYTVQSLLDNVADQGYVLTMLNDSSEGLLDLESDMYSYNIMGYSGKFHFNQSGAIITHPDGDDKIVPVKINDVIRGWQITTKEGIIFYLGLSKDHTREANDTSNPTGTSVNIAGGYSIPTPGTYTTNYISSWQLMELEMPSGESFSFEYQSSSIEFWNLGGQRKYFGVTGSGNCFQNDVPTSYSINSDFTHRLTRINGKTGYILLNYDQPRLDLVNDFALTGVQLYNNHDQLVDQYQLEYDYFISTQHLNTNTFGNTDQRRKRLYLKRIVQTIAGTENQAHSFAYNTDHILPDRLSFAQDAWGYYNGQSNGLFYP